MADQVFRFAVTVPAGTAVAAPVSQTFSIPEENVDEVEIVVPDGCSGLVGFALVVGGTNVIPYNAGSWITGNNEVIRWPITGNLQAGSWGIRAYNADAYDHTLEVRLLLSIHAPAPAGSPLPALVGADLAAVGLGDLSGGFDTGADGSPFDGSQGNGDGVPVPPVPIGLPPMPKPPTRAPRPKRKPVEHRPRPKPKPRGKR